MARHKSRAFGVGLLTLTVILLSIGQSSAGAEVPSVEDIFRKPQFLGATLSPSGRYLAVTAPVGEKRGIGIIDLDTRDVTAKFDARDSDVLRVLWQSDERLIAILGDLQRVAGERPHESGVVAVNRDGTYSRLVPGSAERIIPGTNEIILAQFSRLGSSSHASVDLFRYDTVTMGRSLITLETPGDVIRWVVDFDGVPRALESRDFLSDTSAWYVRKSDKDGWTRVEVAKAGLLSSSPLQFSPDGKILYVAARRDGADRASIYEYIVESGRWGDVAIRHPERDVEAGNSRFIANYRTRKLLGLRYASDRPSVEWFDATWARIQKSVDAALPDTINSLQGGADANRWIVVAQSDRNPGDVYLLDGKTMRMEKIFSYEPWIDAKATASTRWVRYPARDGLSIPALLTVPAMANDKRVPLIVYIHGGPHVEATEWGYQPDVQFFASRGYAVLQPQFRGTMGFGWKHLSSGYRKWGDEMQDDLEDGVKWAVAQGVADSSRVCFYGGSYGGYAAIWGAIKNAALIKCAVAFAAPTSIDYMFDNAQTDLSYVIERASVFAVTIGDPKTERARFNRVSPLNNAERVGVPILLAYGGHDVRVPLVHGTDFRAALEKYGKNHEWVQYPGEGHGFNRDENVFDFYRRVERFLAKYLSGESAAAKRTPAPGN